MMNTKFMTALAVASLCAWSGGHAEDENAVATESTRSFDQADIAKISEAFGHMIGKNLSNPGFHFDLDQVVQGMRDGAAGKESPMTEEEYERTIAMIQESVFNELSNVNLKQANEFLSQNINDKEVLEVEPGMLQYKVLEVGAGVEVKEHDTPLIHYTGKYLDGTVFGSSTESKDPISLPLDQTIPGFSKGLLGSREGEKRRLFIHPDMGYGTSGHLPPNSLLIFDVEVVRANSVVEEEALEARAEDAVLEEPVVAEPVLEEATLEVTPRAELSVENAETREEVVEGLQ